MKRLLIPIFALLGFLLSFQSVRSQTIEYDFQNKDTLIGTLPFDRSFRIKFTHVDTTKVSVIVVKIYEVGVTNYRRVLKKANYHLRRGERIRTPKITITNQDILDAGGTLVIAPDTIPIRESADSTAFMTSLITLRPSTDYFIEITTRNLRPLSKGEYNLFTKKISRSRDFADVINAFAYQNIDNARTSFDNVDDLSDSLNAIVEKIVDKAGPQYSFRPVNLSKPLADLFLDISNMNSSLDDMAESFKNRDKDKTLPKVDSMIGSLKMQLLKTDWTNITKDDNNEDHKAISDIVQAQKKIFAALPNDFSAGANLDRMKKDIDAAIDHKKAVLDTVITRQLVSSINKGSATMSTYPKEFIKQAGQFIRSDLGLAYVWGIGRVNPYVGAQISLGPLDDSIPLREYKGFGNVMRSRLSFLIGVSVDAVAKDSIRRGVIGTQALILGTGFKLWQWLKVNSGFYFYYGEPRNPLQDRSRLTFKGSPFVSLSIDIRIQSLLNGIGNSIFKTQTP